MSAVAESLPITETHEPAEAAALASLVADCYEHGTVMYPLGGGTSLNYGLAASEPGVGISLAKLNRVIDYPARDMTITVEAGITLGKLAETLAAERQWLPVEGADAETATLGGLMATASSGPRRYGYGTMRDYVIGMSAVDGRGTAFKAGGRVVKNVAGYDFCKLLTGSLGTLGIISQITLKVRPRPERAAFLVANLRDFETAEKLLAAIVTSATAPTAVELLAGPTWRDSPTLGQLAAGSVARLAIGLEGTAGEVDWMLAHLAGEWRALGIDTSHVVADDAATRLWSELRDFAAADVPLVLKANVLPGRVAEFVQGVQEVDPQASVQAHAGNGVVIASFAAFEAGDISRKLIGRLHPAAQLAGGSAVVLSSTLEGLTRQAVWGNVTKATPWMTKVKQQFDPKHLLNPGRFVYPAT